MNCSSVGAMRKKETLAASASPSAGYFAWKRSRVSFTSAGFKTTLASPVAWMPLVLRKSGVYSSMANETTGFWSMCRAVAVSGRVQT